MSPQKTGLHKDVSVIFNGVWDPDKDNIQPSFEENEVDSLAYVQPAPTAVEHSPQEARFVTIVKVFAKAPASLFSSKRRREKKRLSSISKHLLINQSS